MNRYILLYGVFVVILASSLTITRADCRITGPDSSRSPQRARLTIQTDVDSAIAIVDGVRAGVTPLTIDSLSPGPHLLVLQQPDHLNWLTSDITDTIQAPSPGESRTLRFQFERRAFIISQPYGAGVYASDSLCGTTPLLLAQRVMAGRSRLTIRKEGYDTATVDPANAYRGVVSLVLSPLWQKEATSGLTLDASEGNGSRKLKLYIAGASTVLSGIAAAYLKVKADDRYLEYTARGDPTLLAQTHRLDTAAGIVLGVTQVCFGIFSYFLLSD